MILASVTVHLRLTTPEDTFQVPYYPYASNTCEGTIEGRLLVTELKAVSWESDWVEADGWKIKADGTPSRSFISRRSVRIGDLPAHIREACKVAT